MRRRREQAVLICRFIAIGKSGDCEAYAGAGFDLYS